MRISYDDKVDALSIVFQETTVTIKELAEGISGEYDKDGVLVGVEILDAAKRLGGKETLRKVVLEGLESTVSAT